MHSGWGGAEEGIFAEDEIGQHGDPMRNSSRVCA